MGNVSIQIIPLLHLSSVVLGYSSYIYELYCYELGPPVIQQPEHDNKKPVRGSRVTLHCKASGYGSLIYYWERRISENHKWFTIDHLINKISHTTGQTGQYRCNVTNEAGSVVSPVITAYRNNPLV